MGIWIAINAVCFASNIMFAVSEGDFDGNSFASGMSLMVTVMLVFDGWRSRA